MNILIAPNDYYVFPTCVMLKSLFINTPLSYGDVWNIYIMHEKLNVKLLEQMEELIKHHNGIPHQVIIPDGCFDNAPLSIHITKSSYYRLLAPFLLPTDIKRVLYLDGDLIV